MQDPLCYGGHSYIQENFTKLKQTIDPTGELVNQLLTIPELRTHVSLEDMKTMVSPDEQNAYLLRVISQLSPGSVNLVIRALQDNDQPHAAALLSGPLGVCGNHQAPMSDCHRVVLEYLQLQTDLSKTVTAQNVDALVDVLIQKGIFQRRDVHRVTSLPASERMKELLEIVMRKWDGAFDVFMHKALALGIVAFESSEIIPAQSLTQAACDNVFQTPRAATTSSQHQTKGNSVNVTTKTVKSPKRAGVVQGENRRWLLAWFKRLLDEESVPGLRWMDESHRKFYLPWPTFSQASNTPQNPDGVLFLEYAKQTGKYCGDKPDFSTWKQNLRNAIMKSKEIKFVKNDQNKLCNHRVVELRNYPVAAEETKIEAVSSPTSVVPAVKPVIPNVECMVGSLSDSFSRVLLKDVEMQSQKDDSCERSLASTACRQQLQVDATTAPATVGVEGDMSLSISFELMPTADTIANPADIGYYGLLSVGGDLQQQQHLGADSFPENIFEFHASNKTLAFIASNSPPLF